MPDYRITKFDPAKRNPDGSYQDHAEWTSITDIGNPKYGNPTYEEYEAIEDGYVQAILLIMGEKVTIIRDTRAAGLLVRKRYNCIPIPAPGRFTWKDQWTTVVGQI